MQSEFNLEDVYFITCFNDIEIFSMSNRFYISSDMRSENHALLCKLSNVAGVVYLWLLLSHSSDP